jgi:predicted phage terminase large subunit-like protein
LKTKPPPRKAQGLSRGFAAALKSDWRMLARPEQLPPKDFSIWLFLAGRGSGKNWADAHYVHEQAATGAVKRIALIGATSDAVRFTMVEGQSGILTAAGAWERPTFEAGKGQLTWPSGTIARLYSADSPELLRGPEHDLAWCDELASWRRAQETWDNLVLTMRLGKHPKIVISTTPKPTKLIKDLVAREGKDGIVITRSTTYDNRANLPPSFFAQLVKKYEGSRTGRQELLAELLMDTPGSLWKSENLEATRVTQAPAMQRIVVAIDPSGSGSEDADECGIIVAGLGQDGEGYVLADLSGRMSPTEWARRAIDAYRHFKADRIIAETNFGSLMVIGTIAAIDPNVPTKAITSSRGKVLRAEPISTLFEQGRCHLVGSFPELEDQATSFTSDYDRSRDGSPDRVDALVFAFTELMCNQPASGYFSVSSLLAQGEPVATPKRITYVLAVAATPSKSGEQLGVVFLACDEHKLTPWPLVIVDYDLRPVDDALFESYLPALYERLAFLAGTCETTNAGLWLHGSSGVSAALKQQATERGYQVNDIDEKVEWAAAPLADRAAAASRHLHTGRRIKIARAAYEKLVEHRGFTRNHLLAEYGAFRIDEELEYDELLRALLSGVLIALENSSAAAIDASEISLQTPPAAPAKPVPLPPPHVFLKPGTHVIDGATVNVPADGDRDIVMFPLAPGRHIIDSKIAYVTPPGSGIRVD